MTTFPDVLLLQFGQQQALEAGKIQIPLQRPLALEARKIQISLLLLLALETGKIHLRSLPPIGGSRGLSDRNLPPK
jgi:hypothetical protein